MILEIAVSRVFSPWGGGAGSSAPDAWRSPAGSDRRGSRSARLAQIYALLADYRGGRSRIIPERFFSELRVLGGGVGEGTQFQLRFKEFGGKRTVRATVTEPEPGRVLVETDLLSRSEIRYELEDEGANVRVTIRARMDYSGYSQGERLLAALYLRRAFQAELRMLEQAVREPGIEANGIRTGLVGGEPDRWGLVKQPPASSPSAVSRFVEAP